MRNLFLLALASTFSLVSCTDRQGDLQTNPAETRSLESYNMLVFDDAKDFFNTIDILSKMSKSELTSFEASNDYISIGRKSDEFYQNINFDNFQTQQELMSFMDMNSKYVSMVNSDGELSTEPFLTGNVARYIANEEGLFAIKDTVYKVLEQGFVSTSKNNISALFNLDSKNFSAVYLNQRLTFAPFKQETNSRVWVNGPGIVDRAQYNVDRDRIVMKIECFALSAGGRTSYELSVCASPQKRVLGAWHATTRTIKFDFYVKCSAQANPTGVYANSGEEFGYRVEHILYGGMSAPNINIHSYNCRATTPSVDFNYAHIQG